MAVTLKDQKTLWARGAGVCSFPGCGRKLVMDASESDDESIIGDVCHIVAREPSGPRGDHPLGSEQRDKYANLILLCRVHHKLVDDQPSTYTVDCLSEMKAAHEKWVCETLEQPQKSSLDAEIVLTPPAANPYEWGVGSYGGNIAPLSIELFVNFYLQNRGSAVGMLEQVSVEGAGVEPDSLVALRYTGIRGGFRTGRYGNPLRLPMRLPPDYMEPVCCHFYTPLSLADLEAFALDLSRLTRFSATLRSRAHGQAAPLPDVHTKVLAYFGGLRRGICRQWREYGRDDLVGIVERTDRTRE